MPEFDKEEQKAILKDLLLSDEEFLTKVLKRLIHDHEFFDFIKKILFSVINDIYSECGKWTLKCIAYSAMVGLIALALYSQGWGKK